MMHYLIEFGDNTLNKTFQSDADVIKFCEYIIDEYEFSGLMQVMKEVPYEDHLGYGYYWSLIWTSVIRKK